MIKVTHIITGLKTGGAEMMLYKLLSAMDKRRFQSEVISLTTSGTLGERFRDLGLDVRALGMQRELQDTARLLTLARWLRANNPDIIQTWMYHANLVGGLAGSLAGRIPVVWNIRAAGDAFEGYRRTTIMTVKIGTILSKILPARIVFNSEVSMRLHSRLGYSSDRMVVIPNGFDTGTFQPNTGARFEVRQELGMNDGGLLIGLVARFHPQKGHADFIRAASIVLSRGLDVHFVLAGPGVTFRNETLIRWVGATGHADRFHFLGDRSDMARITAALDVASSTSTHGEGFSNTIGEAMACGIPCVVTNVGDSSLIVGDAGIVVPAGRPELVAAAWMDLLQMAESERAQVGETARRRIVALYGLHEVAARYQTLYEDVFTSTGS